MNSKKHRHQHLDEAELFKQQQLRSIRRRKNASRYLTVALCIIAAGIFAFLAWAILTGE